MVERFSLSTASDTEEDLYRQTIAEPVAAVRRLTETAWVARQRGLREALPPALKDRLRPTVHCLFRRRSAIGDTSFSAQRESGNEAVLSPMSIERSGGWSGHVAFTRFSQPLNG
jgi:hypothetical protein